MTFCQDIPLPPSANRLWRNYKGRTVKSTEYRQWLDNVGRLAMTWKYQIIEGPYFLFVETDRPHGLSDLDNLLKPINDALQHIGAVVNDNSCHAIQIKWRQSNGVIVKGHTATVRAEAVA